MYDLYHVVNALPPAANAFAGVSHSAPVNLSGWDHASFIVSCGTGATGTAQITVEACKDTTPTVTQAIAFYYQECVSGDTFGPIQKAAASGFATSAAANKVYKIEVDSDMLDDAGYNYVRITSTETVVGAINGGILAVFTHGRFNSEVPASAIV